MRVKLRVDLTKYHPSLHPGVEGVALGARGPHSRKNPQAYVTVQFEEHTLDVLCKDLDGVRPAPVQRAGPQLIVQLDGSPKLGQEVLVSGIPFTIESIAEELGGGSWVLNLLPVLE